MIQRYDAIVIGSGMSGGWSAKELSEKGLNVLVLERGKPLTHRKDYQDFKAPWELDNLDRIPENEIKKDYPIQYPSVKYAMYNSNKNFWIKDSEQPYETPAGKPYNWIRGDQTGGRSLIWSRQSYRMGPQDFTANKEDGHGIDWPIRYEDLAPWYDYVETFAGVSGAKENLSQLPDSIFQPAFELTCAEKAFKGKVEEVFPGRKVINARVAHLTKPTEEQVSLGRGPCQVRNHCSRGCSFGAYFSSNSATLPAAMRTGKCTLVNNAIVQSIEYDDDKKRVTGVKVIDSQTNEETTYQANIVFLNASTIGSAMILLQSKSKAFPDGLANSSGQVGRNLMDHVGGAGANGLIPGFEDKYYYGRRPGGIYIPRYANVTEKDKPYLRGFGYQGEAFRNGWTGRKAGIGKDFKESNRQPGSWRIALYAFGESLPNSKNYVALHKTKKDKWGLPLPYIHAEWTDNELKMMKAANQDAIDMLKAMGATNIKSSHDKGASLSKPGNLIHEMGTARMGNDPKDSVVNKWCQAHDVPNLFITDGSCMVSTACQNPSLTYMALSARAVDYAVKQLEAGNI